MPRTDLCDLAVELTDNREHCLQLRTERFHQGVNLVVLLTGKLRVTQSVLLLTWQLKQYRCYGSLPFNRQV